MNVKPLISVIITTKNSAQTLQPLLKSIKEQTYQNIEVVVVDNPKTSDNTREIAVKYGTRVFVKGPERSAQRNFAAKKAQGEYLLILDSDMILTKSVISECVQKIQSNNQIGAIILLEKSFGKGFWAKAKAFERKLHEGEDYFEAARFFPREIFWEVGGYDENLTGPEDWDLPQRIAKKYKIGRIKNQILHNEGRPTLLGFARRKYYYGLSAHKYFEKQKMFPLNKKTVYFLRPAFYRRFNEILLHPIVSLGMFVMLLAETIGGGLGYLRGRLKNGK